MRSFPSANETVACKVSFRSVQAFPLAVIDAGSSAGLAETKNPPINNSFSIALKILLPFLFSWGHFS